MTGAVRHMAVVQTWAAAAVAAVGVAQTGAVVVDAAAVGVHRLAVGQTVVAARNAAAAVAVAAAEHRQRPHSGPHSYGRPSWRGAAGGRERFQRRPAAAGCSSRPPAVSAEGPLQREQPDETKKSLKIM